VPRFIFLIFGKVEAPRDFQTLLFEYIGSGKVVQLGPFAPGRIVAENERKKIGDLLERWEKVNQELLEVVKSLPEEELDTYSLPHPSMGMMSLREVLYLLIIHPIHHTYKVEQKLAPYM
ncbi:MAG: DinB family protein, partial [Leptospiraceae bacterium]|nr:DinB family protein [Leptospiraceae bacterium]